MVLLSAGGTGGHLFPAEALANALKGRGHGVALVTDRRATPFLDRFPADEVSLLSAQTPRTKNPVAVAKALGLLGAGFLGARRFVKAQQPAVAVGFGGYPTVAPLLAARTAGVPCVVHEANAVPGSANAQLARFAHVATSFPATAGFGKARSVTFVGMPVRPAVLDAVAPYAAPDETFRLLVFGGSQGARAFTDLVPPALAALPAVLRARLALTQQCRPEDMDRARAAYDAAGIAADLAPFFADLPQKMAGAHLVMARSGASTVAELATIGRPAFLVPLPGALDQDQAHNAEAFMAAGGGVLMPQAELTPETLAAEFERVMTDPAWLTGAAAAARTMARPDAAEQLADLAERIAAGGAA
ncbi:MAG: undecaprenyldiphospho-muramoylpentapeptide beta-N-acetylglucosaminyltransferase [Acuticoccus sp.]